MEWCDVRMICGQSSEYKANKKEWFKAKQSLREEGTFRFPNLPYCLDEDGVRLVQTDAILRYLAKKYDLMGTAPSHLTDMFLEEARDLDDTMVRLSYEEGAAAVAKWLDSQELRDKLKVWEAMIQENGGTFVMGAAITVVDLKLYTFLFKFQHAQATLMTSSNDCPPLPFFVPAYLERVKNATPQLAAYLDCPDMRIPVNNSHASFDNS